MDNRLYQSLEGYAEYHHAALLAEAQKARLIKESIDYKRDSLTTREKVMHFQLGNVLTGLVAFFSHVLAQVF